MTAGLTSIKALLVAMKERPHTVTANRSFQIVFVCCLGLPEKLELISVIFYF
jgi:hypothetical protein